jgi:sarcosine oxidase subunit alpha
MEKPIALTINGRTVRVPAGISVAAALLNARVPAIHRSPEGAPRGPLCGMGTCYECRVTIDGVAGQRACLRTVEPGMRVITSGGEP